MNLKVVHFIILNPGAFAGCHDYISADTQYKTCVQDYCRDPEYICDNFASYADQCRAAGGSLGNWRDSISECGLSLKLKFVLIGSKNMAIDESSKSDSKSSQ